MIMDCVSVPSALSLNKRNHSSFLLSKSMDFRFAVRGGLRSAADL